MSGGKRLAIPCAIPGCPFDCAGPSTNLCASHLLGGRPQYEPGPGEALQGCPFHASTPADVEIQEDADQNTIHRCMVCGAFGPDYGNEVGATWNTRAPQEAEDLDAFQDQLIQDVGKAVGLDAEELTREYPGGRFILSPPHGPLEPQRSKKGEGGPDGEAL